MTGVQTCALPILPDIQCSFDNIPVDDCIDVEKLKALSQVVSDNIPYYYNLFELSTIVVKEIYPDVREWTIYDNPLQDFSDQTVTQLPVSIYYPIDDEYAFGYLDVGVYR